MNEFTTKEWKRSVSALSDEALLAQALGHARGEREQTAWLVAHLAEIWRRDLALKRGYSSLHRYAREALGLTDAMAWERVSAARLALEIPETIERLARGELTLAAAGELWKTFREQKSAPQAEPLRGGLEPELRLLPGVAAGASALVPPAVAQAAPTPAQTPPSLSGAEKRELFTKVLGKSRRESEAVLQAWREERAGGVAPPRRPPGTRTPRREWTEIGLNLSAGELALWDRLRDLLSHRLGSRDPHDVLSWLVELGLDKVDPVRQEARAEKRRTRAEASRGSAGAKTERHENAAPRCPEQETAHRARRVVSAQRAQRREAISVSLRREIWIRDQGRCQHEDPLTGRKCGATAFLDFDHAVPVSAGGPATLANLRLACASHNRRRPRWASRDQPRGS